MTNTDNHADYEDEPVVSYELDIARRTESSARYNITISEAFNHPTGTPFHHQLLLTEEQARAVRNGVYTRDEANRLAAVLSQYHDRNFQIALARSGGEKFTAKQLASALVRVLEAPLVIGLPAGIGQLEIMLEKSG